MQSHNRHPSDEPPASTCASATPTPVGSPQGVKVARVYVRVSTDAQDLQRQDYLREAATAAGYYVAGIYREKASGARADRPELLRMIDDLQPGEVVIAEKMDRISRLPLPDAERLVGSIKAKGATLSVPGVVDLDDLVPQADGISKIVLESIQEMLLRLALHSARDEYETRRTRQRQGIDRARLTGAYAGRKPNQDLHRRILMFRSKGCSIKETATLAGCSLAQVKRISASHRVGTSSDVSPPLLSHEVLP